MEHQVRGLLVLLLSRAAGPAPPELWRRQRKLAEILEMIHTGQAIHQAVLNLPVDIDSEEDPGLRDRLQQLEFGNKVATDWNVPLNITNHLLTILK